MWKKNGIKMNMHLMIKCVCVWLIERWALIDTHCVYSVHYTLYSVHTV